MADESGTVKGLRISSAWLSPQIVVIVVGFVVSSFAQWKLNDYKMGQLEMAVVELTQKFDRRAASAEQERLEWARASQRFESALAQLEKQAEQERERFDRRIDMLEARILRLEGGKR